MSEKLTWAVGCVSHPGLGKKTMYVAFYEGEREVFRYEDDDIKEFTMMSANIDSMAKTFAPKPLTRELN